jgi:hypothetical protein
MPSLKSLIPSSVQEKRRTKKMFQQLGELTEANRGQPDRSTERRLLRLRHRAFQHLETAPQPEPAGNGFDTPQFETPQGIPEIQAADLTAELARAAILAHGAVHVRGLFPHHQVESLRGGIDRTFAANESFGAAQESGDLEDWERSDDASWYHPFKPLPGYTLGGGRNWGKNNSSIWAADSPRLMFELIDAFERRGISKLIGEYLGERPAISMNKTVLRRVSPRGGGADWHQDGAFLGKDIRSLNVWLALTRCGDDAPGMDIVARRLDDIVPTGGEGANFDWSVGHADAERAAGEAGIVRPVFEPGDALLFDHLMLHRTASEPTMSGTRYAIETWFFAPSVYPTGQVPLVL